MAIVKNPSLNMSMQKGFIFISPNKSERQIVCNWCMRELYSKVIDFFEPIETDIGIEIPCDLCGRAIDEGPEIISSEGDYVDTESDEGTSAVGLCSKDSGLAICVSCFDSHPEYMTVVKDWSPVKAADPKARTCMVCQKELGSGSA